MLVLLPNEAPSSSAGIKPAAHKARFVRFFTAASTLHAIWQRGHAHSRQPTCGNAAHEALRREKVTFDAATDE